MTSKPPWSGRLARCRAVLDTVASVAMIAASLVFLWMFFNGHQQQGGTIGRPEAPVPSEPVSIKDAHIRGMPTARVAIIEFSDFACPFCGRFARETLPALLRDYIGKGLVQLAFRHLPLESMHPLSRRAAEASECAGRDDRFWMMHDHLFAIPADLTEPSLRGFARRIGLDSVRFGACLDDKLVADTVSRDVARAKALGVTGTPSFLIGVVQADGRVRVSRRLSGALPYSAFSDALDRALRDNGTK